MNAKIAKAIAALPEDRQLRIQDAILALGNGWVESLEFSGDGSCVTLTYKRLDVNGVPAKVASTLSMDEAALALARHRLKSHELPERA